MTLLLLEAHMYKGGHVRLCALNDGRVTGSWCNAFGAWSGSMAELQCDLSAACMRLASHGIAVRTV